MLFLGAAELNFCITLDRKLKIFKPIKINESLSRHPFKGKALPGGVTGQSGPRHVPYGMASSSSAPVVNVENMNREELDRFRAVTVVCVRHIVQPSI